MELPNQNLLICYAIICCKLCALGPELLRFSSFEAVDEVLCAPRAVSACSCEARLAMNFPHTSQSKIQYNLDHSLCLSTLLNCNKWGHGQKLGSKKRTNDKTHKQHFPGILCFFCQYVFLLPTMCQKHMNNCLTPTGFSNIARIGKVVTCSAPSIRPVLGV